MILQALCHLAERDQLVLDGALEERRVDFVLTLDRQGKLSALVSARDEDGQSRRMIGPRAPKKTSGILPGLLFDNSTYVLGVPKRSEGVAADARAVARASQCADSFAAEVAKLAAKGHDEALQAVARFVADREAARKAVFGVRPEAEWLGDEWIGFGFEGDERPLIYQRPGVLSALRMDGQGEPAERGQCLLTGEIGPIARLHPSIKRVPQGQSSGASVVSFNAPAFQSHGLEQGSNAPISERAAILYSTALNHLLEGMPDRRFRSGVPLGDDAVIVFWTREKDPTGDFLASLFAPGESEVRATLESPWRGLEAGPLDAGAFYALTLGGNASRVVVRDWFESTTGEIKQRVRQYFEDLRLGDDPPEPTPIWKLLQALAAPGGRGISPLLATRLARCALSGSAFPLELLGLALRRLRIPPDERIEPTLLRNRIAVIKAVLNRRFRNQQHKELTVSLDETSQEVPYLLGRLFAVIERLQAVAQGRERDLNATIRDKFFGSASATPALVFPRLLKLSAHHASKAEQGGLWLEKLKGQIIDALPPSRFPKVLALEDQGLFGVGYYHQRERFFRSAAKPEAAA